MTVKIPVRLQPVRVRRENDIQREVLQALRKMGKFCLRLQSGKVKVKGGWMSLCAEGTPDILVIESVWMPNWQYSYSRLSWIEMKSADGKHREKQIEFMDSAIARGERYVLARSLDDVISAFQAI